MSQNERPRHTFVDPHGYQPILVDEWCLTKDECRQTLEASLRPRSNGDVDDDWRSHLTPAERKEYKVAGKHRSPYYLGEVSTKTLELQFDIGQRGRRRGHARRKYANGASAWYGDGPPPWQRTV